jgi:hypothetical protein
MTFRPQDLFSFVVGTDGDYFHVVHHQRFVFFKGDAMFLLGGKTRF